jgi:hypothetical protein
VTVTHPGEQVPEDPGMELVEERTEGRGVPVAGSGHQAIDVVHGSSLVDSVGPGTGIRARDELFSSTVRR